MTDTLPHDDDMLAAEYALRLLQGQELETAETRVAREPEFAALVRAWDIRLARLTEDLAEDHPSENAKRALMARLFPSQERQPLWRAVGFWQALTAACVVCLGLLSFWFFERFEQTPSHLFTAEIAADAGDFRVIAVVDKSANEVILTKTLGQAPAGRILQVWAHGPGAPASSVGLWPDGDSVRLPLPPIIAAVTGTLTLGVSEEPIGGSPTGSPSGRVYGTVDIPNVAETH